MSDRGGQTLISVPAGVRRVLMLASSYLPRLGGVERHVYSVTRELIRRGVEVRIATPRWQSDWAPLEMVDGVEVTRLSLEGKTGRKELRPLVAWANVVHSHDAYPFLKYYLPFLLTHRRLPAFVTFHGYERYPIPLEAKVLRRVVLWLTRGAICAGAFIPKWYKVRCEYITHGGVDAPAQRPPLGEGAVFVGRLERDTGFLDYLEAFRLLKTEHNVVLPLDVCGEGGLKAQGEAFAQAHGLTVRFHGRVSDPIAYLARARFACVSGLLAILEAMASGAIVLALYDTPLKEDYLRLFPGAQHIIIVRSPAELAVEAVSLLQSPERAEKMAAEAFEFAQGQTWQRVADLYEKLWASVI